MFIRNMEGGQNSVNTELCLLNLSYTNYEVKGYYTVSYSISFQKVKQTMWKHGSKCL